MADTGIVSSFAAGDQVLHRQFGTGIVIAVRGAILEIAFETAGTRKIQHDFVKRS